MQGHDHPALMRTALIAVELSWVAGNAHSMPFRCTAKTRYRQTEQACEIERIDDGRAEVRFDEPQRAVTPGQSVVFYDEDVCIGGGIIDPT